MLVQTARLCGQTTRCQLCRLLLRLPLYLPYSALRRDCCHTNAACRLFIHIGSRRRCHFAILALLSRLPEGIVCTPPPLSLSLSLFLLLLDKFRGTRWTRTLTDIKKKARLTYIEVISCLMNRGQKVYQ